MKIARAVCLLVTAGTLAACLSQAAAPGGSPGTAAASAYDPGPSTTATADRPVDKTIEAVSLTRPSPEAAQVLLACGATKGHPERLAAVAAMGLVPHAKDVPKYTFLWGQEPEIATDAPAWVIQFTGKIDFDEYWAVNPVCVSVDGDARIFAPERHGVGDKVENPPTPNTPTLSLPAPLP